MSKIVEFPSSRRHKMSSYVQDDVPNHPKAQQPQGKNPLWFLGTNMDTVITEADKAVLRELLGSAIPVAMLVDLVMQRPLITVVDLLVELGVVVAEDSSHD